MKVGKIIALLALIIAGALFWPRARVSSPPPAKAAGISLPTVSGDARQTWGNMETLADHVTRHGRDFGVRNAEDYAALANAFLQQARTSGLPAKRSADGTIRVFDPETGTFGAYNANGTTKTFFKPGKGSYFDRQPGEPIDLRTAR